MLWKREAALSKVYHTDERGMLFEIKDKRPFSYFIGIAVILLAVLLIGGIYTILSQTSQANIYLGDTRDESNGWEYEVLSENAVQPVEPVNMWMNIHSNSLPRIFRQ